MWNNRIQPQPTTFSLAKKVKIGSIIGGGVIAGVFGLSLIFGSWYTVDQRERGVILRNGKLIGVADPGLGFKLPILDKVVIIKTESYLSRYEKLGVYSRDQQPAEVSISVRWRAIEKDVDDLYTQYGNLQSMRDRVISPTVFEELRNVFGQYNAVTAIQDRTRLNTDVRNAVIAKAKGPFIIESVQIENIDFSDAYEKSIEERMLAEVEVQKLRQNAEREKVNAEITVTQAKARADSVREAAIAEAEAIKLRGDAMAAAIEARGKALRDNSALVELTAAEKWDGKLPTTMVPGAAIPFVQVK